MEFLRNLARSLAATGFRLSIVLFAVICSLVGVLGNSQPIKTAVAQSNIYDTFTETLLKQLAANGENNSSSALLDQPEVSSTVKAIFDKAYVKNTTEQIIDGSYHWLEGKAVVPDFNIDMGPAIATAKNSVADAAANRAKSLPACSLEQLQVLAQTGAANIAANPFKAQCLPPGFNINTVRQQSVDSLTRDNEFLQNPVLTADRLPKDRNGQTIFQQASVAPRVFGWLSAGPWVLGPLVIALGLAVVFLNRSRRRGIRSIGASFIGNGILLLIIGGLASYLFSRYMYTLPVKESLGQVDGGLQQATIGIAGALNRSLSMNILLFGGAYTLFGVVALIMLRLTRPTSVSPETMELIDAPMPNTARDEDELKVK